MDFAYDARTEELRADLLDFMDEHVHPAEPVFHDQLDAPRRPLGLVHGPGARGAARRGPPPRAVEPLPAARARRPRSRPDQPPVRAARRDHRPQRTPRARRPELRGTGHRQHGGAGDVRHRRAEGALAAAAPRRPDPLGVRDDRAGRRVLRRHQHRDPDRARRRRVRRQRAQVVDHRGDEPADRDLHRHGQDGPRRLPAPAAEPAARAPRHPRADRRPSDARARLRRPLPRRPRGAAVRGRAGARSSNLIGGEGDGFGDRPGATRPRPDPPLHALDRRGRARDRADVPPGRRTGRLRATAVRSRA